MKSTAFCTMATACSFVAGVASGVCALAPVPQAATMSAAAAKRRRNLVNMCPLVLSVLIDAAADCRLVEPFAIHLLRLDLLGHRVHEFIRLPEAWVLLGELDALFEEGFAVDILVVDLVGADARFVGAVRENHAVEAVHHYVKVAVDKRTGWVVDLGIDLLGALCLDGGDSLLHHGYGIILGQGIGGESTKARRGNGGDRQARAHANCAFHRAPLA